MAPTLSLTTLHLSNKTYISGEAVTGYVDLTFPLAQDDNLTAIKVVLRGEVSTTVLRQRGQASVDVAHDNELVSLMELEAVLWTRGPSYPPTEAPAVRLPFELQLPDSLPPSFHFSGRGCKAALVYAVEVISEWRSRTKTNTMVRRVFTVVPAGNAAALDAVERLTENYNGPWTTHTLEKKLRSGLWGIHSHVKVQLILPEIPACPISTEIPLQLNITTSTKPMKRKPRPVDIDNKPPFPASPSHTSIDLRLDRRVHVTANGEYDGPTEIRVPIGGFGANRTSGNLRVTDEDPEWVCAPGDEDKADASGVWRRVVRYRTHFTLNCPPTFSTKTLSCEYFLSLHIPFPGMLNDLRESYPLTVVSGAQVRPPSYANAIGPHSDNAIPPPQLPDLPPMYWEEGSDPDAN